MTTLTPIDKDFIDSLDDKEVKANLRNAHQEWIRRQRTLDYDFFQKQKHKIDRIKYRILRNFLTITIHLENDDFICYRVYLRHDGSYTETFNIKESKKVRK